MELFIFFDLFQSIYTGVPPETRNGESLSFQKKNHYTVSNIISYFISLAFRENFALIWFN